MSQKELYSELRSLLSSPSGSRAQHKVLWDCANLLAAMNEKQRDDARLYVADILEWRDDSPLTIHSLRIEGTLLYEIAARKSLTESTNFLYSLFSSQRPEAFRDYDHLRHTRMHSTHSNSLIQYDAEHIPLGTVNHFITELYEKRRFPEKSHLHIFLYLLPRWLEGMYGVCAEYNCTRAPHVDEYLVWLEKNAGWSRHESDELAAISAWLRTWANLILACSTDIARWHQCIEYLMIPHGFMHEIFLNQWKPSDPEKPNHTYALVMYLQNQPDHYWAERPIRRERWLREWIGNQLAALDALALHGELPEEEAQSLELTCSWVRDEIVVGVEP